MCRRAGGAPERRRASCGWRPRRRPPTSGRDWRPASSAGCAPRTTSRCGHGSGGYSRTCTWCGLRLASTTATFLCGAIALGTLQFASPERHDSMAAVLPCMAAPSGSDLNPARLDGRYRFPSVPQDGVVQRTLESTALADGVSDIDTMLAVSAVVTLRRARLGPAGARECPPRQSGLEHPRRHLADPSAAGGARRFASRGEPRLAARPDDRQAQEPS